MELTLDRLTKQFGSKIAVDRVSATLTPGVTGLLGANGAGKTTLMRMVCDVLRPTSGQVLLDGRDATEMGDDYRALLGYLPQDFGCYPDFSALDFMCYMATLKGFGSRDGRARSMQLLEEVGLAGEARRKVKTYSGGMKQRLGLAMALVGEPDFLILDEPINGLDPTGIMEIRELLLSLSRKGKTIFISSHILGELEKVATRYGIISSGKLIEEITALRLHQICVSRTLIRTDQPEKARSVAQRVLQTDQVSVENGVVVISSSVENIGELTSEMFASGIVVSGISNDENSAESYFIRRMEEGS